MLTQEITISMSYYLFKVRQDKSSASLLEGFEKFSEASARAKILRRDLQAAENVFIKLVHATDPLEGERFILEKRQPSSPVEEWEA
ncbi:conserved hypothetical protein [Gammaproteobacteria bacterium]